MYICTKNDTMAIITNEQARYLMGLKKKILIDGKTVDNIILDQMFPLNIRYEIISEENSDYVFLWQIKQSSKLALQVSLHYQENESKIGLLRVDYNRGHKNPDTNNGSLSPMFIPYIGKWFDDSESHVHFHEDGYKPLAWAVPIEDTEIEVKSLGDAFDANTDLAGVLRGFAKIINLETVIQINRILL